MDRSSVTLPPFVARYRRCFDRTWADDSSIDSVRFVVLDSETTGLNPRVDRLITIGAVAVQNSEIIVEDSFDALIKIDRNTEAVTVHGVTRDQSLRGVDEAVAIEKFLDYLGDGVIVGHHIGHDISTLDAALERHWGITLANRSLDTDGSHAAPGT
jgi:DNA polymerase-3 subunit epsilon